MHPLICVTLDLIQRGCPTPLPPALEEELGPLPAASGAQAVRYVHASALPDWQRTIKGAPDGFNPALRFWEALCAQLPSELAHLRALIEPEASLVRILEAADIPADEVTDQRVDFYCPLARLAIEVDGSQHEEAVQQQLDQRRHDLLRLAGVRTLRITVRELADPAKAAARAIEALRSNLALRIGEPVEALSPASLATPDVQAIQACELAMRMQVAFLSLMRTGQLSPDAPTWRIRLAGDAAPEELQRIARAALEDAFTLLSQLAVLADVPFTPPNLLFVAEGAQLVVDVSAFRTWDDGCTASQPDASAPSICIRSSHDLGADDFRLAAASPVTYQLPAARHVETDPVLRAIFTRLFGHEDFKPGQLGIIRRALSREPTLGILPTGSGKSACYQMACLLQPAISFVVCPIISLIQDQDANLRAHGIARVACISSQMSTAERSRARRGLGEGRFQIIWVSPERFQDAAFRHELLQAGRAIGFGCAVIDEVHCLSEWGHDFRVSYLLLRRTFSRFCPGACLLGLTATASRDVLADLKAELGITAQNIQTASQISRPELRFHIKRTTPEDRLRHLDELMDGIARRRSLGSHDAPQLFQPRGAATICGIVFANTRTGHLPSMSLGCEEIKDHLRARGIPAETYHSGRAEERAQVQRRFMDNEFSVMVATKSFGMGIDKPNVRFTIHANLPWSVEAFYQEAGRAGRARANNESDCCILYVPDDDAQRMRKLFSRSTTIEEIHQLQPKLKGDLSTIFFLWTTGFSCLQEELERVLLLLAKLEEARTAEDVAVIAEGAVDGANIRPENAGMRTEKALYKLAVCGLVTDWTRDWNAGTITVQLAPADGHALERAERAVEEYISRHSPGFSFTSPRQSHMRYVRLYEEACADASINARFAALIGVLLAWTDDTIVFSRRAAIGNMLALCEAGLTDDQLAAYLDGYFKLDTHLANRLERVAENPDDLTAWLDVFYEYAPADALAYERQLRSDADLADVVPLADRFRESYPDSIGIEWVSLMAKLLANSFTREDICDQFAYVFNAAGLGDGPGFDELLDETAVLVERCGAAAQAAYEDAVATWQPDFEDAGASAEEKGRSC